MATRLLPIGTVIEIRESEQQMMIAGFAGINTEEEPEVIHDYIGFPYPLGFNTTEGTYYFDNTDIGSVLCVGYQDGEAIQFIGELESKMDELKASMS